MGGISGGGRRRGVIGSLILDHVVRESESMSKRGNLCTFAGCGVLEGVEDCLVGKKTTVRKMVRYRWRTYASAPIQKHEMSLEDCA